MCSFSRHSCFPHLCVCKINIFVSHGRSFPLPSHHAGCHILYLVPLPKGWPSVFWMKLLRGLIWKLKSFCSLFVYSFVFVAASQFFPPEEDIHTNIQTHLCVFHEYVWVAEADCDWDCDCVLCQLWMNISFIFESMSISVVICLITSHKRNAKANTAMKFLIICTWLDAQTNSNRPCRWRCSGKGFRQRQSQWQRHLKCTRKW